MNREEQAEFIADLMGSIQADLIAAVEAGRVPIDWQGRELRRWISENVAERAEFGGKMSRTHIRQYQNERIVNNI